MSFVFAILNTISFIHNINRGYGHSAFVYEMYLTRLGELLSVEPWRDDCYFSQSIELLLIYDNSMYIFYVVVLFIIQSLIY